MRIFSRSGFIAATLSVIARRVGGRVAGDDRAGDKQPRAIERPGCLFVAQLKRGAPPPDPRRG